MTDTVRLSELIAEELATGVDVDRKPALAAIPTPTEDVASLTRTVKAIKSALEVLLGSNGSALDRALTARDLLSDGVFTFTPSTGVVGGGEVIVSGGSVDLSELGPNLETPPAPTSLFARGAFKVVTVTWSLVVYRNHAYVELWRATTDNRASAVKIANVEGNVYADADVVVGQTYFYWVRAVNIQNAIGPWNATAGTQAGLTQIGNTDLGDLVVEARSLAAGSVSAIKFAPTIAPVTLVAGVPATRSTDVIYDSITGKLYRWNGTAYTAAVPGSDVVGAISSATISAALLTGQITETQISNNAISTPKLAAGAVTTAKIEAGAVTADQIAANAVTAGKIAANAVTAGSIAADAVTAGTIAAGAITASKLSANAIAVGTAAIENGAITNAMIATLSADKIVTGSMDAARIGFGTMSGDRIQTNTLQGNRIVAGTITADRIQANSITGDRIAGNTITADKISTTDLFTLRVKGGAFTGYAWPPPGQNGFYLGPEGLLIGNESDGRSFAVNSLGNVYAPQFKIEWGAALFTGTISTGSATDFTIGTGFIAFPDGRFRAGSSSQYIRWTNTALEIKLDNFTVNPGSAIAVVSGTTGQQVIGLRTATVSGGTPPYTYFWQVEYFGAAVAATISVQANGTENVTVVGNLSNLIGYAFANLVCAVTDANGRTAYGTLNVDFRGTSAAP